MNPAPPVAAESAQAVPEVGRSARNDARGAGKRPTVAASCGNVR
ncbi:hypothetical protein [Lysobacter gummosus]